MKKIIILLICLSFFSCDDTCNECLVPETESYCEEIAPLDNSKAVNGFIELDIIPDKYYMQKGFVSSNLDRRWEDGIVPYFYQERITENGKVIQNGFKPEHIEIIDADIETIKSLTGVRFIKFDSEAELLSQYKDGVKLVPSILGSSNLGKQGGIQETFLSVPAPDFGEDYVISQRQTTFHELGHTLGLYHEHSRTDRDDYIVVNFDNIHEGNWDQFTKQKGTKCGEYDLLSVMHYSSYSGSKDENSPSMLTIEGEEIPINYVFSEGDIKTIKSIYQ